MKKILIISPHFPPINSADMHRVRQSLPYYRQNGYEPVVVVIDDAVEQGYSRDENLLKTIPPDIEIHRIKPLPLKKTRMLGIGSIAIRSFQAYYRFIKRYIKHHQVDLLFFSTTAFHLMYLGALIKKKYGIPFVLDFQDPWRNDFFIELADNKKNPKYRAAYEVDKFLEKKTVPLCDGIIAVSQSYCDMLQSRYPGLKAKCKVLTFGANTIDFDILQSIPPDQIDRSDLLKKDKVNFVYVGRGGHDLSYAAKSAFAALAKGLKDTPQLFDKVHFSFIGTSYAAAGQGVRTIEPLAKEYGVENYVTEITDRIPYFQTLYLLNNAHGLIILGSEDTGYTASKIYPYVLAKKPLIAIFNENSSVIPFLKKTRSGVCISFRNGDKTEDTATKVYEELKTMLGQLPYSPDTDWAAFEDYTAASQTQQQTFFFDDILKHRQNETKRKKVLIISPHFPPVNAPDMQRVRMSLPYFREMGWEPVMLVSHEESVVGYRDLLLLETIPKDIEVHKVKGWSAKVTQFFGFRSLSMRSYWAMKTKGNHLLSSGTFDLIYFSTTMFHVCALGRYWKKKFKVPFVIDLQDPWRNDFYLKTPGMFPSFKHRISYRLDKYLEAITMPFVDGLISVSRGYLDAINERYSRTVHIPSRLLSFGYSPLDFELINEKNISSVIQFDRSKINVIYIGAVTKYFVPPLEAFFKAFKETVEKIDEYRFYFIGTNYSTGSHKTLVNMLARQLEISHIVTEMPDRISYFAALATMKEADILFVPGSIDVDYNASKIYNCILSGRPIFSVFNWKSEVKQLIESTNAGVVVGITGNESKQRLTEKIMEEMPQFKTLHINFEKVDEEMIKEHSAYKNTVAQVELFNKIVK
ncbi:MAG TPA: glycosyltransferase [Flavipsychrobacter sp.]|nr:glycosyltransferase [Flavipsychrobacter sp.]